MPDPDKPQPSQKKQLRPAARRALQEAQQRRKKPDSSSKCSAEKGGPKGLEPTRYGDWERGGRTYDF